MYVGATMIVAAAVLAYVGSTATLALSRYDAQAVVGRDGRREYASGFLAGFILGLPLLVLPYLILTVAPLSPWVSYPLLIIAVVGTAFAIPARRLARHLKLRVFAMMIAFASVALGLVGQYWFETSKTRLQWRCDEVFVYEERDACWRYVPGHWELPPARG